MIVIAAMTRDRVMGSGLQRGRRQHLPANDADWTVERRERRTGFDLVVYRRRP